MNYRKLMVFIVIIFTFESCGYKFLEPNHVDDINENARSDLKDMISDKLKDIPVKLTVKEVKHIKDENKVFDTDTSFNLDFSKLFKKGSKKDRVKEKKQRKFKRKLDVAFKDGKINERKSIQDAKRKDHYQDSMNLSKFEEIYAIKLINLLKQDSCSKNANLKVAIRIGVIDCLRKRNFHIDWRVRFISTSKLIIQDSVCYNRMSSKDIMSIVAKDRQCIIDSFKEGKFISPMNLISNNNNYKGIFK